MDPHERATAEALADKDSFRTFRKTALTKARVMDRAFVVETTEGTMEGKPGDYLCLDTKGNPYPCAKDVFDRSYEEVASEAAVSMTVSFDRGVSRATVEAEIATVREEVLSRLGMRVSA